MKLDWGQIPIEIPCPRCQEKIDKYQDLGEEEWKYLLFKNPEPLQDYHRCPNCHRVWIILRAHIDEIPF